ncbi:uncharacterized protein [Pleurodeles waltl]|uniref:uncharacterized protein n=1 Tax=Pleurodeles waltl TaxID=8319 RepID=UPI0037099514
MKPHRSALSMWCFQTAILCVIVKWTFFSSERQLDPDAASVVDTLNPLLDVTLLPRFSTIKPSHVTPGIIQAAEEYQRKLKEYVRQLEGNQSVPRTWEFVEESLEVLQFPFFYSWQVVTHLLSVKSSPELREAHQKVELAQHLARHCPPNRLPTHLWMNPSVMTTLLDTWTWMTVLAHLGILVRQQQ